MDPQQGQLTVQARTRAGYQPTVFRVQVFQEGWIQLVPEGTYVQSGGQGVVSMPAGVVNEYVGLADGLLPRAAAGGSR